MSKTGFLPKILTWLAVILILETGLLHIVTAQGKYQEAAYLGYLFAANFSGSLIAALGIYHRQVWGWALGLAITAGSIAGYVWSRTVGLPGTNVEEWFAPYGIVFMAVESAFIFILLLRPWKMAASGSLSIAMPRLPYVPHLAGLFVIGSLGIFTYQWDASVIHTFGHHVGSLGQVCNTPPLAMADLEQRYGIQVSLVAVSMLDSIVDVRIKVVDPDKAEGLLQNQAALLVGQQFLIIAPHMHSHSGPRLKAGKIFTVFFPTQQIIRSGSFVSLILGPVRVEPVLVR